jgi:N-acetylglucosaminyldiphosphoundecaprenol N-acetyl-beta-D-mannosaminyltransferase
MQYLMAEPAFNRPPRPTATVCGLNVSALGLRATAEFFVNYCRSQARSNSSRPLFSTSLNGHAISLCARDASVRRSFRGADLINADGQPMVALSRLLSRNPLPERVATTDLFPEVARFAKELGLSFYMLGGSEEVNRKAVEATLRAYPSLRIVGRRHGYFNLAEEPDICAEITALRPNIWVGLGIPFEQQFCIRNVERLRGVGIIKTAGGLLDFLSLKKPRAPKWMQNVGFEWLFRLAAEPRRLFVRYTTTNPHALIVMFRSLR